MRTLDRVLAVASLSILSCGVQAQPSATGTAFPQRPLRMIVPFPPGGATDIVGRIVAEALTEVLGTQVVVDNRGGAGGNIGASIAAHATPDGYTLFTCNIAGLTISPWLYRNLDYDAAKDFAPLGLVGSTPNVLIVPPSLPVTTVAEFVALAKSRGGKLNYGSAGVGTSPQLSMELFRMKAGIDITHIPYKGGAPALIDLIGGQVQAMFSNLPTLISTIRAGRVRPIAVTSKQRAPELPDVPTIAESGIPDFEVTSWQAQCIQSAVPAGVLGILRTQLTRALALPSTAKRLADQGMQPSSMSVAEFEQFIRAERAKWSKVIKDAGIDPR